MELLRRNDFAFDREIVAMLIAPAHRSLDGQVELTESECFWNSDASPDHWLDGVQLDGKLEDFFGFGVEVISNEIVICHGIN